MSDCRCNSSSKCDTCDYADICKLRNIIETTDNPDDPCEGCSGPGENYIPGKGIYNNILWWTKQ